MRTRVLTKNVPISGVGGWLAVLIFGFMLLGPAVGTSKQYQTFADTERLFPQLATNVQWQNYTHACWLVCLSAAVISFSAGYRLWKLHNPGSVRFAIVSLWLIGPVSSVTAIILSAVFFGVVQGEALSQMTSALLASVLAAAIWTAYLRFSLRVQNTYHTRQVVSATVAEMIASSATATPGPNWWRRRSRWFRLWAFCSLVWIAVAGFYFVAISEDYVIYTRVCLILLVPPLLVGAFKFAYERWIR